MMKNMKTMNIIRSFAALFAVSALMAASCDNPAPDGPDGPDAVIPSFPSLVENNDVAAGETLTLTFEANMDWTVTVPSSSLQWFWIQDNSFKVDKVTGKVAQGQKESVTIQIGVSETEEFDTNRSCEVTLAMGGETKVIAKYMRPAKNRTLAVYAAQISDQDFVISGNGGYEYESSEASSLDLIWSAADADFRMPVKVEANCEWQLEMPQWLDVQVPESTIGSVDLVFAGASVEAASGKILFKAGDSVLKEFAVSVPSCGEVKVYSTQIDEYGEFCFDDNGGYLYSAEPVDAITLAWPGSDYRMPVMVDAKCDWTVEMPQWLTMSYYGDAPEKNSGILTFNFMGDPAKYPLEDATENVTFKFDGQTIHQIAVTIPGCSDKFSFGLDMSLTSLEFNSVGQLMTSVGFQDMAGSAWMYGTETAQVAVVEMVDGKKTSVNPEWVVLDVEAFVQGGDVLQRRAVSISVSDNDGAKREACLLFCKDGSVDGFFAADGTLVEEMSEYVVYIFQYGSDMEYITMTSTEETMASGGAAFGASDNPRLTTWFGDTDYVYELVYSNIYARDNAFMSFARPYTTYKIFNSSRKDMTDSEDFWLTFTPTNENRGGGVIDMYAAEDAVVPESSTTGYVVFYDSAENPLAIIEAIFDPQTVIGDTAEIKFIGESAQYAEMVGATLEEITEGPLWDQYKEYVSAAKYHLTYRMMGMPMKISIPSSAKMYMPNPYMKRNIFMVNGLDYDETVGRFSLIDGGVDIYMVLPEGSTSTYERGNILFYDSENTVVLVLVCTLDLTE